MQSLPLCQVPEFGPRFLGAILCSTWSPICSNNTDTETVTDKVVFHFALGRSGVMSSEFKSVGERAAINPRSP